MVVLVVDGGRIDDDCRSGGWGDLLWILVRCMINEMLFIVSSFFLFFYFFFISH